MNRATYNYSPSKQNIINCSQNVQDWLANEYIEDIDWHIMSSTKSSYRNWYTIRVTDAVLSFIVLKFKAYTEYYKASNKGIIVG